VDGYKPIIAMILTFRLPIFNTERKEKPVVRSFYGFLTRDANGCGRRKSNLKRFGNLFGKDIRFGANYILTL
jgi:hypothetical protein